MALDQCVYLVRFHRVHKVWGSWFSPRFRVLPDMEYSIVAASDLLYVSILTWLYSAITINDVRFYKEHLGSDWADCVQEDPVENFLRHQEGTYYCQRNVVEIRTRFNSEATLKAW